MSPSGGAEAKMGLNFCEFCNGVVYVCVRLLFFVSVSRALFLVFLGAKNSIPMVLNLQKTSKSIGAILWHEMDFFVSFVS